MSSINNSRLNLPIGFINKYEKNISITDLKKKQSCIFSNITEGFETSRYS